MSLVKAIIAVDPNGVIGVNNSLPWRYKADMQRFKTLTKDGAVVMGRKTFDSIPIPKSGVMLPGRLIVVVTRDSSRSYHNFGSRPEVSNRPDFIAHSIEKALEIAVKHTGVAWIIGGAEVYLAAMKDGLVDEVDYTLVPEVKDIPEGADVVRLPPNFLDGFDLISETPNVDDPQLIHRLYRKCSSQPSK